MFIIIYRHIKISMLNSWHGIIFGIKNQKKETMKQ